jgi:hypothetical protein
MSVTTRSRWSMATASIVAPGGRPAVVRTYVRSRPADRAQASVMRNRSTSSGQPTGVSPVWGDARVPGSEAPVRRREAGCEAGWIDWPVRSIKRSLRRRECSPPVAAKGEPSLHERGEGHGTHLGFLERVRRNPSAYGAWNGQKVVLGTGETLLGPSLRGREQRRSISGSTVKWLAAERESEGVVVVPEGRDNITRPERRTLASSMHVGGWEGRR